MDPEFRRILFRVVLVGGTILAIGAGILAVAFRSFGRGQTRDRDLRPLFLIGVLLLFVLTACVLLMRLSMIR